MKIKTELVHPVALAVLHALSAYEFDDFSGYLETAAFYNGRERGVAVIVHSFAEGKPLAIVFGENRRSDQIFVDEFEYEHGMNPPTIRDFTQEAYQNRRYFSWDQIGTVSEYIHNALKARMKKFPVRRVPQRA
jgi:hypothetical protein